MTKIIYYSEAAKKNYRSRNLSSIAVNFTIDIHVYVLQTKSLTH